VLPEPALTPADACSAARMDQLMNINDWYLFAGVGNVIAFQRIVGPRVLGLKPDEQAIAAALPKAQVVLDQLARELGTRSYFAGEQLTLADLLLAPQLEFLSQTPEWAPLTAKSANLHAWLERMGSRPSMRATTWERVAQIAEAA
jgi:glutathione S-transferase